MGTIEQLQGGVDDAGAVVHRLRPATSRPCARPGCASLADATLTFRYAAQEAVVERLSPEPRPQAYDLCLDHAARTSPPRGWTLRDRRPEDERRPADPTRPPPDLGGDRTVAVLAAALRAVPDAVSERAVTDRAAGIGVATTAPDVASPPEAPLTLLDEQGSVARELLPSQDDVVDAAIDVAASDVAPASASAHAAPSVPRPPLAVRDRGARAADW